MPRSFCTDCRANRRGFELFTCGTKGAQEVELMQGVHHSHHCGLAAGQYLPLFVLYKGNFDIKTQCGVLSLSAMG